MQQPSLPTQRKHASANSKVSIWNRFDFLESVFPRPYGLVTNQRGRSVRDHRPSDLSPTPGFLMRTREPDEYRSAKMAAPGPRRDVWNRVGQGAVPDHGGHGGGRVRAIRG